MTCVKRKLFFRLILRATPAVGAVALTAAFCAVPAGAADYVWPVKQVIDGDTVAVDASADFPPELSRLKVRLRGVDTPGIGRFAKCRSEREVGQAARAFTEMQIEQARQIAVRNPAWGQYGGRIIADLRLDGRSLTDTLIESGHGRPYRRGRPVNWCR